VGLLQGVDCLVVLLKFVNLFAELRDPGVEARFQIHNLRFELDNLGLVVLLEVRFLLVEGDLVLLKLPLAGLLLAGVTGLQLSDLLLPGFPFLGPRDGVLLLAHDLVGAAEEGFDFLLVGVLDGRVHRVVLLVLAVQVEDHFR
jgi:hypothetical protein